MKDEKLEKERDHHVRLEFNLSRISGAYSL